ncbi:FAD-dependent oxidoreductase [Mycolicibacterium rufum]|uniref:FAD-dependent oxidoreductase n=1 Tax=Mycolicibacterium rufum TaxID=318424 RepID=A0A9X2YGV8_9MYCO|nr:FAD-dependent oxidoreductase [Mycolicibacterium rufum]KGI69509.1 potassium transporter [Mycolicibacterium rufum]MCV7073687.1 FAD-dependent oxidoreductase [Mycolicibacterium rufum]ULP35722.1 FAD-dependent oxidoreductase [Mycolicibacterium rufum]
MDDNCDVCIVGAGLAGLNALFVASRYLTRDQKVILVDRRPRVGGMWVDTYPYVRLHQPHPMFTAGNIAWTLNRDRSYLADKGEVLDHFTHCLAEITTRITLDERYGWTLESDEETADGVHVTCRDASGDVRVIRTGRLIKAYGFRVMPNDPLELSSTRVHSVSPDHCDVRDGEMSRSDAPVWVIGGGKTAMDTAHAVITRYPGREVNLLAGSGTMFTSRDHFFPDGAQRWWGGTSLSSWAAEVCRRFDGTNEEEMARWFLGYHSISLTPRTRHLMLGVLSEAERKTIAGGLNDVVMDHLVDVVDRAGSTDLVLRSGATTSVQAGSWIVNCTGYLTKGDHPYEPYMSAGGATVSVQTRSATLHFSSYSAYFLTHLMFLGKLRDVPLYELDLQALWRESKQALPFAMFALAQYNLGLIADAVPGKVFAECGLDFNRWYPWHRRMAGTVRFMATHRRERAHLRRSLDTVGERFGVRCGPLQLAQA